MIHELWSHSEACYALTVVRGSPNPRYLGLPSRLKKARKQTGWTRMALAEKAGASDATVGYLEAGQRLPSVGTVVRLASALGLSAAWLAFGFEEQQDQGKPQVCEDMGARLQAVRAAQGHTKASLARLAELNPGSIAGIENGGQAGVDTIERLAKELRISPAWLAFGVGPQVLPSRRGTRAPISATDS